MSPLRGLARQRNWFPGPRGPGYTTRPLRGQQMNHFASKPLQSDSYPLAGSNMGNIVLESPKLYLDTSHLINIAKVRKGESLSSTKASFENAYRTIDELIRERHFGIVFNPAAPLEWVDGNATLSTALEIANVIDTAPLQYEIEGDSLVYLREVLDELQRLNPELILPHFPVFSLRTLDSPVRRGLAILANSVPEFFDEGQLAVPPSELAAEVPYTSARFCTERAWQFKFNRADAYQERVNGFRFALDQDMRLLQERPSKKFVTQDFHNWIRHRLKADRILTKLNPDEDPDRLLDKVELSNCPAISVYFNTRNSRIRSGHSVSDNDVDDWMYLPTLVYADLVLSERQLSHFVRSANPELSDKITHDPNEFVRRVAKWM